MSKKWVRIYSSTDSIHINILRNLLEEHDIPTSIINKQDSMYPIGHLELHTFQEMAVKAINLIKKTEE